MKFDFSEIEETILRYYPLGISEFDPAYAVHPKTEHLRATIKIKLQSEFETWNRFVMNAGDSGPSVLEINCEPDPACPSFGALFSLHIHELGMVTYSREICFKLSMIGRYYTVYGIDSVVVTSELDGMPVYEPNFEPVVFTSPRSVYYSWFTILRQKIEKEYPNYSFVKFGILSQRIEGLHIGGIGPHGKSSSSVFQALFAPIDITLYRHYGDPFYK